ncbi:DNA polymerase III subunit delta [Pelagibacterales bacterium]|nr:DNA polymerase III subunit delta [Pelagibacterales bacterium]
MLVKENVLIEKFKEQKINYPPILIYGPNEGLVRENFLKIKKIFNQNSTEEVNFSGKLINEQPGILIDEIQTVSMFNEQKIIIIEQPIDKNIDLFEDAFAELPNQILIIVIANNLTKNSKLRKFFESSNNYFSCANYEDDFRSNSQQIQNLEKSINKNLNRDIKSYLGQHLSSDRMISKNEIDKIILLYSENDQIPELEHIKLIFNDNADLGLNKISQLAFSGQPNRVSINLNKIFDEGVNPVAIIRVMLNYVQRIQATQIALKKNNDFDSAIKSLKPPVFWKDKDNFKLHCKKWPIKETVLNFNLLVDTELNCKSDYNLTNILCERALLNIAVRGQKYFSN